jgi:hypothetical protein
MGKYLHIEKNPDKVYFSDESPALKKWCEKQISKSKNR